MSRKSRIQVKRELSLDVKPRITLTRKGLNYLLRKYEITELEVINYRRTLEELCQEYNLRKGVHYIVSIGKEEYKSKFNKKV